MIRSIPGSAPIVSPVGSVESAAASQFPAAPTRLGRELPADEVRPSVPEALSALAERALHPEEPDGIHAVGAIAALLRSPETVAGIAQAPQQVAEAKPLSPADRRLIKERRVKLSLAAVVLAVFAVLIVIALGGLTNQFVASIQNSAPDELPMIDSALASTAVATDDGTGRPGHDRRRDASSAPAAATDVPVKAVAGTVFDPQGDGTPDYKDYVDRAFDGNAGLRLADLGLQAAVPLPEDRGRVDAGTGAGDDADVGDRRQRHQRHRHRGPVGHRRQPPPSTRPRSLGTGTVTNGTVTIPLTGAPKSKYLLLFVTKMSPTSDNQFQSKINEVTDSGQLTSGSSPATGTAGTREFFVGRVALIRLVPPESGVALLIDSLHRDAESASR